MPAFRQVVTFSLSVHVCHIHCVGHLTGMCAGGSARVAQKATKVFFIGAITGDAALLPASDSESRFLSNPLMPSQ